MGWDLPACDAVATAAADLAATKQITHKNNWISVISQFQSGGGGGQVRGTKRDRAGARCPGGGQSLGNPFGWGTTSSGVGVGGVKLVYG